MHIVLWSKVVHIVGNRVQFVTIYGSMPVGGLLLCSRSEFAALQSTNVFQMFPHTVLASNHVNLSFCSLWDKNRFDRKDMMMYCSGLCIIQFSEDKTCY